MLYMEIVPCFTRQWAGFSPQNIALSQPANAPSSTLPPPTPASLKLVTTHGSESESKAQQCSTAPGLVF